MVKITTDSTADLNADFEKYDIGVLPLNVILDGESHLDGETISPDDIYAKYAEKKILPKTAARSPEDFKAFFERYTSAGDEVVHINISSKISMTHENAAKAASEMKGVYVVDSLSLSSGTGLLVLYAAELAKKGLEGREIAELVRKRIPHVQTSFVVDTMDYLHKGGRCSSLARIAATVLRIKPTILMKDGAMEVGKKYMGSFDKVITKYVENTLAEFDSPDLTRIFITHTSASPETVNKVREKITEIAPFAEIKETIASSTITSHCGKGTLGILYINDGEKLKKQ